MSNEIISSTKIMIISILQKLHSPWTPKAPAPLVRKLAQPSSSPKPDIKNKIKLAYFDIIHLVGKKKNTFGSENVKS